jgi:hypothetical protein
VEVVPVGRGEEEGGACGWRERGGVGRLGVANLWSFGILVRVCWMEGESGGRLVGGL